MIGVAEPGGIGDDGKKIGDLQPGNVRCTDSIYDAVNYRERGQNRRRRIRQRGESYDRQRGRGVS